MFEPGVPGWAPLARAITAIENAPPWTAHVVPPSEPIHVIGITGPPGTGKSTLTGELISRFTAQGRRVGVVAVDPSSPVTGGAILGDRVRMEHHLSGRDDVFVRSLASRGSPGALRAAAGNVARLLESSQMFDLVIIETVGSGQTDVAIAAIADTVVMVTVPGLGDAVQTIKAGVLEVADLVVVNMADRPGARETARHYIGEFGNTETVIQTVAISGTGVELLHEQLDRRWKSLNAEGELVEYRRAKELTQATLIAQEWVRACADDLASMGAELESTKRSVRRILEEALHRWDI